MVERFFSESSPYQSIAPTLFVGDQVQPRDFDFMTYSLPSESELSEAIRSCCKEGSTTIFDLLANMEGVCRRKFGAKEKILDIVHRKCDLKTSNGMTTVTWKE